MKIEYEATFENINPEEIQEKLKVVGAELMEKKFLQKRDVFSLPSGEKNAWLRVRDEGGKKTLSLKFCDGEKIDDQKEICLTVDDYSLAVEFLKRLGCQWKAYQETWREKWLLDGVEVTIDEWPFLEPFLEIEGGNESAVKKVSRRLDLDYQQAFFGPVGALYKRKYGISLDEINDQTDRLVFEMENPFEKGK